MLRRQDDRHHPCSYHTPHPARGTVQRPFDCHASSLYDPRAVGVLLTHFVYGAEGVFILGSARFMASRIAAQDLGSSLFQ